MLLPWRRRGGFSPLSLSPTLWLKADAGAYTDAGTTLATDGQTVRQFNDQSGNGNHASQATAGNRPLWIAAGQNGLPVLRFDGIDDYLDTALSAVSQPYTLFIVGKATNIGTNAARFVDANSVNRALFGVKATTGLTQQFAGSLLEGAGNRSGAFHQWTALYNGASSLSRMDGASEIATANAGTNSWATLRIGADNVPAASSQLNGDICEIILYPSDQTTKFATVEGYLKTRWGTP